jgi:hypothetical protein
MFFKFKLVNLHFWRNYFYFEQFDQFGYTKHERAFCTQIGFHKKTGFRPIWVQKYFNPVSRKKQANFLQLFQMVQILIN